MTRGKQLKEVACYIFTGDYILPQVDFFFSFGGCFGLDCLYLINQPKMLLKSTEQPTPYRSPFFRVIKIAAGETHSVAVTEKGDVFMWGNKEFMEPERVVALNGIEIIDIGAGRKYSACLSDQGELYTFGAGRRFLVCPTNSNNILTYVAV